MTEELVRNNMRRSRMLVEGSLSYDESGEHHEWTSASDLSNGTWSLMTENTRLSRDSILPPSVCACSTSGARSTNTITPCCISTCTTHDRSLANCLMCSLDRATTCIVCLISHISFTYLYVRVLHLTVCMCQLRPRIRFRCHTLSHAFQCGRIAPAVLALNTTPTVTKR